MGEDVELRCKCGEVRGRVTGVSPGAVNRVVCYCDDCQAYLHYLGRTDLLDAHGGSDIVQVAPASLTFHQGADRITGVRLTPKGLYRWYSACCKTPLGNHVGPGIPFVGIAGLASQVDSARREDVLGPATLFHGKFAVGEPPAGSTRVSVRMIARFLRLALGWRFGGRGWPHPFLDRATGAPMRPLTVLTLDERARLRPLCGPRASAAGS
jgi:hypothetical protein